MSSGDKLITLAANAAPQRNLEDLKKRYEDAIIRVASADPHKVFSADEVEKNGFEFEPETTTYPDFVNNFWDEMTANLNIEIEINDTSPGNVCHHILVCQALTPFKLDLSKLYDLFPQEYRAKLDLLPSRNIVAKLHSQNLMMHLLSTAYFDSKIWTDSRMKRLNEEDTNCVFFHRFANSGFLPKGAQCLLYVCVFPSRV